MGEKGFGSLATILPTVEANYNDRLLKKRQLLHDQLLEMNERYEQNPQVYTGVSAKIKTHIDSVVPLFASPTTSDTDLEQIQRVMTAVHQLIENPQAASATEVMAPAVEIKESALSQEAAPAVEMAAPAMPAPETTGAEPRLSVEQMKSNLSTLDEQVNALYDKRTIPFYEELKAKGLTDHFNVKRVYGNEGQGGQLLRAFDVCAIARTQFIQELSQTTEALPSKKLLTLYKKFNKQVAVLERQVEWHLKNLSAFIETQVIENVTSTTPVEAVPLEKLILDASTRVPEETIDFNKVEVSEAEKLEFEQVHHMETAINQFEQEIKLLQEQTSWQPGHEAGKLSDITDQFDRTLADYYEQPSAALFEQLQHSFAAIETLYKEAKDEQMLAATGTPVTLEQPQEPTPSSEVSTAEKMTNNIVTIADKYRVERESLGRAADELLANQTLPAHVLQSLTFAKFKMLAHLEQLSYTDPQYMQLRERIKEVINAAQQVSGEEITVAPAPKIEGVANHYLAPVTRKKLSENPKLRAALLVAMVAMVSPESVSKFESNFQVASVSTESPLSRMGKNALWNGDEETKILPDFVQNEPEKIVIIRPNNGEEESPLVTPETSSNTRIANMNFVTKGETLPVVTAEAGALPAVDLSEDNLPKVSEIVVNRVGYEPVTLEENTEATVEATIDSSVPELVATEVADLDPKSPAYQETVISSEVTSSSNNIVEVLRATESTYPDRAINPLLAAVDSTGVPEVLANKLRAEEKEAFLSDANRLKAAGVGSGQKNVTFPGEKINYSDPVKRLEQRFNEYRKSLNVPHTEVAVEGDNLTKLVAKSFARDLSVLGEADRLSVIENALNEYLKTPGALENIKLQDKDTVPVAAVVPLQVMAKYLADAVAEKVRTSETGSASEIIEDTLPNEEVAAPEVDIEEESGSASEIIEDNGEPVEVTSPENYPGGVMGYSQAYNQKLESLGISPQVPSMLDSWFSARTPDNRGLLTMTVGEITDIMMQGPANVLRELNARKISPEAADAVYRLVIDARAAGLTQYARDSKETLEEVISRRVLSEASINQ